MLSIVVVFLHIMVETDNVQTTLVTRLQDRYR